MGVNLHHFQYLFFTSSNCCSVYINAVYILCVIIELLFSIFSENISGKTISMSVLGVCGLFVGGNSPNLQRIPNTELVRIPDALLTPTNKPHIPKTLIDMVFPEIFSEKIENNNSIITPRI